MLHDPQVYAHPHEFKPERFIAQEGKPVEPNPRLCFFGFGRRICPGKELADTTLWLEVAMVLAAFNVSKKRDAAGNEITPPGDYTSSIIW